MKLAKLSLAATIVAGLTSSSFAADTLADAFKNGTVNGELRAWYTDREGSSTAYSAASKKINSDIFNTGLVLGYITDSFYGFKLGATFQSNYAPFADGPSSQAGTAKSDFASDEYGSGSVLSEAYVQYTLSNTTAKVGRQFITTPLVNGSGSRMIKQAFEGAMLTNTDLPQTTLAAGVITKYQPRTSSTLSLHPIGDAPRFDNLTTGDDYAYTLLAINKSLTGTTLTAQWAGLNSFADFYYLEAAYMGKSGSFSYGLSANYELKDSETAGQKDGTMYGTKLDLGFGGLNGYVAYTRVTNDNDVKGNDGGTGFGGGTQLAYAKGYLAKTGTYDKDSKAYSVDVNYNFKQIGLLAGVRYTDVTVDSSTIKDRVYSDVYAEYAFSGTLKGLSTVINYQDWSKDVDGHDFWFKANYKF